MTRDLVVVVLVVALFVVVVFFTYNNYSTLVLVSREVWTS